MKKPQTILSVKNLSKHFGGVHAVEHCSFEIRHNSITGLIGPNGAGKTTMFDLLSGLLIPDTGEITFQDQNITAMPPHRRARHGLARTFQMIRVFPEMTVIDNVTAALLQSKHQHAHKALFVRQKEIRELQKQSMAHLHTVKLHEKAHLLAGELSYGQQKLLEMIRAVAMGGELFLLDEPAAGINPTMLTEIITLIRTLQQQGKTILIIEHNMGFVMNLCEEIIVMDRGKEIAVGAPKEIQKNPRVLEAYLGTVRSPI